MAQNQKPKALKISKELVTLNHKRTDNYYWMNQRDSADVLKYIDEDNKVHEVDEITENVFLLITESKTTLENDDIWKNVIIQNIHNFILLKAKEHPSLSSRCIFKHMDMK